MTIFTNVAVAAISFNGIEIQRVYNITRTEALTPHDTSTLDKPERGFVITYNPALRSISSIIRKHFHVLISSPPVAITSVKLHPL